MVWVVAPPIKTIYRYSCFVGHEVLAIKQKVLKRNWLKSIVSIFLLLFFALRIFGGFKTTLLFFIRYDLPALPSLFCTRLHRILIASVPRLQTVVLLYDP